MVRKTLYLPVSAAMLEEIVEETIPFDKLDLLSKIAALQLMPENANHAMSLDAIAHAVASQKYVPHQPEISLKRLKQICNSSTIATGPIGHSEDPSEQMFTEAFTFEGGSYVVFPGIVDDATYVLRNLTKAIFLSRESPFSSEFIQQARTITTAILELTDLIALKAGMKRGIDPVSSQDVVVPSNTILQKLKRSLVFTTDELSQYFVSGDSLLNALHPLIAGLGDIEASKFNLSNGPLHVKPLISLDNKIVVSEPGVLLASLRHHLILEAIDKNLSTELARQYRFAIWDNVIEMLDYMGIQLRQLAPTNPDTPHLAGIFLLDYDKALYVQLITDDLSDYQSDQVFGYWEGQRFCDPMHELSADIEKTLLSQQYPPNEIMDLVLLKSLGRAASLAFKDRSVTDGKVWLYMSASELETIALAEGGDPLVLLKYARARERMREKTEIFSFEQLNEFQFYRKYKHSYYMSDEKLPTHMMITPGFAGEIVKEVAHQRDRHGAPAYEYGYVVEVTCRYSEDIPIYIPINDIGARAADLVQLGLFNIWTIGPDYTKHNQKKVHSKYVGFADMISYWLCQFSSLVNDILTALPDRQIPIVIELELSPYEQWIDISDQLLKTPVQDVNSLVEVDVRNRERRISVVLPPEIVGILAGTDNTGELSIMAIIIESLRKLTLATIGNVSNHVDLANTTQVLKALVPTSSKKMVTISSSHHLPQLAPVVSPHFRLLKEHDEQEVLDSLAEHLASQGWQPGPVKPEDRVKFIDDNVVGYLYERLKGLIATLRFDELVSWLVSHNESAIARLFETRLTIPTRLACFYESSSMVETLKEELPDINRASVALRFLVEYATSCPSNGIRPMTLELFDQLMALSSAIISWGFDSDYLKYEILDIALDILPSGRVGATRDQLLKAQSSFLVEYTSEEISRAKRGFSHYVGKTNSIVTTKDIEELKKDPLIAEFDEASLAEFGLTFTEFGYLIGEIYNLGEGQDGPVKRLGIAELVGSLSPTLRWSQEKVSLALDHLTLSSRPDFLKPPTPFLPTDVYPWRFNRALSYIRRPLIKIEHASGDELMWGNRHLFSSHGYLFELIITSRLFAQSGKMRELMGKFNRERGETFNNDVALLFEARVGLIVRRRSKKLGKKYIRGNLGDLGDIDVLVIDKHCQRIFVIECKDLAIARTPHELKTELDYVFKGSMTKKSTIEKHKLRATWVQDNLASVLGAFNIASTQHWKVEPLLVFDEAIFSSHIYCSPMIVLSYRQLVEDVLPTWDKNKEWIFL